MGSMKAPSLLLGVILDLSRHAGRGQILFFKENLLDPPLQRGFATGRALLLSAHDGEHGSFG